MKLRVFGNYAAVEKFEKKFVNTGREPDKERVNNKGPEIKWGYRWAWIAAERKHFCGT